MRILHFLTFIFFNYLLIGQSTFQKTFTIDDGLPSQIVYDVEQDELGYIWVATEGGLSKYNGEKFTNFTVKDGLHYNEIVSLVKDSKGRIWLNSVGPYGFIYEGKINYLNLPYVQNLYRNFNVLTYDSTLYIISGNDLILLDNETLELKEQQLNINGRLLAKSNILNIENDSLWLQSANQILIIYDDEIKDSINLSDRYVQERINANFLYFNKGSFVYYIHNNYLLRLDRKTGKTKVLIDNLQNVSLIKELLGKIYLYYSNGGFLNFNIDANGTISNIKEGGKDIVSNLLIDREGNYWKSLYTKGLQFSPVKNSSLSSYSESDFKFLTLLESINIDGDKVWMGNQKGELILKENDRYEKFEIPIKNIHGVSRILDIKNINTEVLILSSDSGLFLFNTVTKKFKYIYKSATKKITVRNDVVLISTYSTSFIVPKSCILSIPEYGKELSLNIFLEQFPCFKELYPGRSYSSGINSKEEILLGHVAEGLLGLDGNSTYNYNDASKLFNVNINKIITSEDDSFIAATKGQGIYLINGTEYSLLDNSNGMSSNICNDVIEADSILYVATSEGLNIIKNFRNDFIYVEVLRKVNGLLDNEIRGIDIKDNLLYAISHKGLNIIDLSRLQSSEKNIKILIESVKVNNEIKSYKDSYALSSNENSIAISFANLDYTNFKTASYSYRLSGLEKEWNYTNASEIRYSGLGPGNYTFEVCKAGLENIDKEGIETLEFHIKSPFHNTSLFRILLALFVIGFILLLSNLIGARNSKLYLESKVEERTKELNIRLEEIDDINKQLERSNKELQDYAQVTSHDLKSPLRTISSFVSLLAKKNKNKFDEKDYEYVEFVKKGIDRMNQVVQDLLDLSKVNSKKEIQRVDVLEKIQQVLKDLDFHIHKKKVSIKIDGNFPVFYVSETNIIQLFQNLISNAIKYNDKTDPEVTIQCSEQDQIYLFSVADNGIGFEHKYKNEIFEIFKRLHGTDTYDGTGIGLAICKKIIDDFNGKIYANSVEGEGSTFFIELPKSLSIPPK